MSEPANLWKLLGRRPACFIILFLLFPHSVHQYIVIKISSVDTIDRWIEFMQDLVDSLPDKGHQLCCRVGQLQPLNLGQIETVCSIFVAQTKPLLQSFYLCVDE